MNLQSITFQNSLTTQKGEGTVVAMENEPVKNLKYPLSCCLEGLFSLSGKKKPLFKPLFQMTSCLLLRTLSMQIKKKKMAGNTRHDVAIDVGFETQALII